MTAGAGRDIPRPSLHRLVVGLAALAAVVLAWAARPGRADGSDDVIRLTDDTDAAVTPDVALDGAGNAHIVWAAGQRVLHMKVDAKGHRLRAPHEIYGRRPASLPRLAVDGAGRVHVVCNVSTLFDLVYLRLDPTGTIELDTTAFVPPRLGGRSQPYSWPAVAIDPTTNLPVVALVVYSSQPTTFPQPGTIHVESVTVAHLDGGGAVTSKAEVWWRQTFNLPQHRASAPALGVDGAGKVHVVWNRQDDDGTNRIAYGRPDQDSFSLLANDPVSPFARPALVVGSGGVHIAWNETTRLVYTRLSTDGPTVVDDTPLATSAAVAAGSPVLAGDETVVAAWPDARDGVAAIFTRQVGAGSFGEEVRLSSGPAPASNPAVGARGGVAPVFVWQDARFGAAEIVMAGTSVRGRVVWENGLPIGGARVEAYYLRRGSLELAVFPGQAVGVTAADGSYRLPDELDVARFPPLADEALPARRGVRASLTYDAIPGAGVAHGPDRTITNYPDWDPLYPTRRATDGPEEVVFPLPVVFQPGLWGRVLGTRPSTAGWLEFLTLDPGSSSSSALPIDEHGGMPRGASQEPLGVLTWGEVKRRLTLPAFLCFPMPSGPSSRLSPPEKVVARAALQFGWTVGPAGTDEVPWGYDNGVTPGVRGVDLNGRLLELHVRERLLPSLERYTPGAASGLPVHVSAHSMGGPISRSWLARQDGARGSRYVSFDAIHGGLSLASAGHGLFFPQADMNGTAPPGELPTGPRRGWNQDHALPIDGRNLLYSSSADAVVLPDASALGIGDVMATPFGLVPNGRRIRAVGGWEDCVAPGDHGLQSLPTTIVGASEFLARGVALRPFPSDVATLGLAARFSRQLTGTSAPDCPGGRAGPPPASPSPPPPMSLYELAAPAGGSATVEIPFDTKGRLEARSLVAGRGARLAARDARGRTVSTRTGSGDATSADPVAGAYRIDATPGRATVTLSAGPIDDAVAAFAVEESAAFRADLAPVGAFAPHTAVHLAARLLGRTADRDGAKAEGAPAETPQTGALRALAVVAAPDGTTSELELLDDGAHEDGAAGDGVFGATVTASAQVGRYQAHVLIQLDRDDGVVVRRTSNADFTVAAGVARFTTAATVVETLVDSDGDGDADIVRVEIPIDADVDGALAVQAVLEQAECELARPRAVVHVDDAPSTRVVTLDLDARLLHGVPGEVTTLRDIVLLHESSGVALDVHVDHVLVSLAGARLQVPDPPALRACFPRRAMAGAPVTLFGSGLAETTEVSFDAVPVEEFTVLDDGALLVVPAGPGTADRPVTVRVVTPRGEDARSGLFEFLDDSASRGGLTATRAVLDGRRRRFSVQGFLDTGPTPASLVAPITLRVGQQVLSAAVASPAAAGHVRFAGALFDLDLSPSPGGSSRVPFRLTLRDDATFGFLPDQRIDVSLEFPGRVVAGHFQLAAFRLATGTSAAAAQDFGVRSLRIDRRGAGADAIEFEAAVPGTGGAPAESPAVEFRLGDAFAVRIAGDEFSRVGATDRFDGGDTPRVRVTLDHASGRLRLSVKGAALGPLGGTEPNSTRVRVSVVVGGVSSAAWLRLSTKGTTSRY